LGVLGKLGKIIKLRTWHYTIISNRQHHANIAYLVKHYIPKQRPKDNALLNKRYKNDHT